MIGSHNSLTYLPAKTLVGKLLMPWTRCQNKTLVGQYNMGVRYFDIRVRFKKGICEIVHNKVAFKGDLFEELKKLSKVSYKGSVDLRLILDIRKKPKDSEFQKGCFNELIEIIDDMPNLEVTDAIIYWNWQHIKDCDEIAEYHASVSSPWYDYIRGIKYCAKKLGKPLDNNFIITLIDYV